MPDTPVPRDPARTSLGRRSDAAAPAATNGLSQRQLVVWSLLVRPARDHPVDQARQRCGSDVLFGGDEVWLGQVEIERARAVQTLLSPPLPASASPPPPRTAKEIPAGMVTPVT